MAGYWFRAAVGLLGRRPRALAAVGTAILTLGVAENRAAADNRNFNFASPSEYTVSVPTEAEVSGGMAQLTAQNSPAWLGSPWGYRQPVTVDNSSGPALTNYEVRLDIDNTNADFWANVANTGYDIRFTTSNGTTLLSYFRESFNYGLQTATLWVKIPSLAAAGSIDLYLYYGNAAATDASDISATFTFGDDFPGASLNGAKWTTVNGGSGTATVSGGNLSISSGGDWWSTSDDALYVATQSTFGTDYIAEAFISTLGSDAFARVWGLRSASATNARMFCFVRDNNGSHVTNVYRDADGGSAGYYGNDTGVVNPGSGYVAKFVKIGDTVSSYYDDQLMNTRLVSNWSLAKVAMTDTGNNPANVFAWVRVRQYVATEPSASTDVQEAADFPTDVPNVQPISSIAPAFIELTGFTQTLGPNHDSGIADVQYQLSHNDGANWYYWDGFAWAEDTTPASVVFGSETNTASDINANAANFDTDVGTGSLLFRAFLWSDTGEGLAQLDNVNVAFTPPPAAPSIASATPSNGAAGTSVTITGANFGATQGSSEVTFNGLAPGAITFWSDSQIVADAPVDVTSGSVVVRVSGFNSNNDKTFTVDQPSVMSLSPSTAYFNDTVTISGTGFGSAQGSSYVTFPNNKPATVSSWGNSSIIVTVPGGTTSGNVTVTTVGGGTSGTGGAGDDFTLGPDNSTWPFTTPGDYTLSDAGKIEIVGGMVELKAQNSPAWYDKDWPYRQPITVNNAAGGLLTNHAVRFTVDETNANFWSYVRSNGFDVRFTDSDGTTLLSNFRYAFDSGIKWAAFWVKVPSIPASSSKTIYVYYGNGSGGDVSNIGNTFVFADDFADGTIDPAKWTEIDNGSYLSESGGRLIATGGSSAWTSNGVWSASNLNRADGLALEWDYKWTGSQYFMFGWKDATGGTSYTNLIYGYYNANGTTQVYEDGTFRGTFGSAWVNGTQYRVRLLLKTGGGATYQRSTDGGATWTTSYDSTYSTETPARIGLLNYNQAWEVDNLWVRYYVANEPSTSAGAQETVLYPTDYPYIENANSTLAYTRLVSFAQAAGYENTGQIEYQISADGTDWYYLNGTTWTMDSNPFVVAFGTETSTAAEINPEIGAFPPPSGDFRFRAFLKSDGATVAQLDGVSVVAVDITYTASSVSPTSATQGATNISFSLELTNNDASAVTLLGTSFLQFTDGSQTYKAYVNKSGGVYPTLNPSTPVTVTFGSVVTDGAGGGVTVPAGISPQPYTPDVRLFASGFSNVPVDVTDQVTIDPATANPVINSLTPSTAASKVSVTISGVNFGASQGGSTVTFNGTSAGTASSWSDTEITIDAPLNVTTGPVVVTVGGSPSNTNKVFTVGQPAISSLVPATAYYGDTVVINGSYFGVQQGTSYVTFPNNLNASVVSWGNTAIQATVPSGAVSGNVTVTTVGGGRSATGGTGDDFTLSADSASFPFTTVSDYTISSATKAEVTAGMAQLKPINSPTWMDVSWLYRQPVTINNSGGGALTNYETKLTINSSNASFWAGVASTGNDIRFADTNGTSVLSHFRESFNFALQTATLWIKVPSIPAGSSTTIYLYYGNAIVADTSDIEATFTFADDFPGTSLDSGKWQTINGGSGTATVSGGALSVTSSGNWWAGSDSAMYVLTQSSFGTNFIAEALVSTWGPDNSERLFGLRASAATDSRMFVMLFDNNQSHVTNVYRDADGGNAGYYGNDTGAVFPGSGYVAKFVRVGDTVSSYYNNLLMNSRTIAGWNLVKVGLTDTGNSPANVFGWARVRQYVGVEPSVSAGAQQTPTYAADDPYVGVAASAGKSFGELTAFSQTLGPFHNGGGASIEYQLSSNGLNWYHWNGLAWTEDTTPAAVTFGAETCTAAEINTNATTFENTAGSGSFVFKAFLHSNTGAGLAQLDSVNLTWTNPPNPPFISSITPTTGVSGTSVTVDGANFGAVQGTSTVNFNGEPSGSVTSWGATQIVVDAPVDVTTGPVVVKVGNFNSGTAKIFTVNTPSVTSLSPATQYFNGSMDVIGSNFGITQGASYVTFPNNKIAPVTSWTNTLIQVTVPAGTVTGDVTVTTLGGGTSSTGGAGNDFTLGADNSTWAFTTPGDYTASDSGKIEVGGGMGRLKAQNSPAWLNPSWPYRIPVTVDNSAGGALTNYSVRVALTPSDSDFWANVSPNGYGVRFTDSDGTTTLSFFRHKFDNTADSAVFWVEIPSVPAASGKSIYLYYGNATAGDVSSMDNTFVFADDFSDGTIDAGKWTEIDNGSYISETGGKLVATGGSSAWTSNGVWNVSNFNRADGLALEWDYQWTSSQYFMFGWKDATAGTSYTNLIYGYYNSNGSTAVYEDGTSRGTFGSPWVVGQDYRVRLILKTAGGAKYERSTDNGATWTTSYDSTYSTETPVRIGLLNYNQAFEVDNLWVRYYATNEPSVSVGSQDTVAYPTDYPYLQNAVLKPSYTTLVSFSNVLGPSNAGQVEYQLSPNGTAWYYLNGSTWTQDSNPFVVVFGNETSTATEINTNLAAFPSPGTFNYKAFLKSSGTQFTELDGVSLTAVNITYTAASLTPTNVTQGDTNKSFTVQLTNNDAGAVTLTGNSYFQFTDGSQTYKAYVDKVGPVYPTLNPSTPINVTFGSVLTDGNGGGVTVPAGISAQAYTPDLRLYASGFSNVPISVSNQVTVNPADTDPIINSLVPSSGASKISVTINGVNFGASQGGSTVTFNGTDAGTASGWSATQITIDAPLNVTTGSVIVTVSSVNSNTNKIFTVSQPAVSSLAPATAYFGDTVTINGTNFGAQQGSSYVKFPNNLTASIVSWGNTAVQATVPAGTTSGDVTVTTAGGGVSGTGGTGDDFTLTADNASFPFTTPSDYTVSSSTKAEVTAGMAQLKTQNNPAWMDVAWGYRQPVTVDNTGGGDLTNYEAKLTITSANASFWAGVASTGFDIRFTGSDGATLRSYFRETWNFGGQSAVLWVRLPSLAAGGSETLYLYYGNGSAGDTSAIASTFTFGDDFPGSSLDTAKWTATGTASVSGGELTVSTGSVYSNNEAGTHSGQICEAKVKWTGAASGYSGLNIANGQTTQGGNAGSNKLVYFMTASGGMAVQTWAADGTAASYNIVGGATQFTAVADTTYVIGQEVTGTQVKLYRDGTSTNSYSGTWSGPFYLWLGYFTGAASGATDVTDILVDWVRVRQAPSVVPGVSTGSQETPSFATDNPYVQPVESAGKAFGELTTFGQTLGPQHNGGGASIEYQLSSNGTNWWYWSGAAWTEDPTPLSVTFGTETCTATEVNSNATTFENAAGSGTLVFRAFLHSNTGAGMAQLDSVDVTFTPAPNPPFISSLAPSSGSAGTPVTISGANLGATQGTSTVTFNGLASGSVGSWSSTQIVVDAPTDVTTGAVVVKVGNFSSNNDKIFTVSAPSVTSLAPSTAYYNDSLTISGSNFGAAQGSSYVTFPNNKTASVGSWTDATITVTVPGGTTNGNVTVTTVGGGTSATGGAGDDFTLGADNSTWPLAVPAEYALSDSGKVEVSGGMARLKAQNSPAWMDPDWLYRRAVTVNNTGGALTNYAVRVAVDNTMGSFWSNVASSGFDVRITDQDGTTVLSMFRYKFDFAGQSGVFWVKAPTLPASSTRTLYLYYGNATAGDVSSMDNTFVFGDDFADGTISTAKWNEIDNGAYISETGGKLVATGGNSTWSSNGVWNKSDFNRADGLALEWDYKWTGSQYFMFGWKDATAGTSYTNLIYGYYNSNGTTVVYEDGTSRGTQGTAWTMGQQYRNRVILKTGGGATYQRSTDSGANWTTSYDSAYSTETPVRVGLLNYNQAFQVDNLWVRTYVSGEPTATVGSQEAVSYPTDNPYVQNTGLVPAYTNLVSFAHALGPSNTGTVEYQLSPNGTAWHYLNGTTWTQDSNPAVVVFGTETSTQTEINTNIGTFASPGSFRFRAFMNSTGTQFAQLDGVSLVTVDITYTASTLTPTSVTQGDTNKSFTVQLTNNDTSAVTLTGSSYFQFTDGAQTYKAYADKVGPVYPTLNPSTPLNVTFGSVTTDGNGGGVTVPATITAQLYTPDLRLYSSTFSNVPITVGDQVMVNPLSTAPIINNLSPSSGASKVAVTINGVNFGASQGGSTVTFNGADAGTASGWNATQITIDAPLNVTTGSVIVTVSGQMSNTNKVFTVNQPAVTSLVPSTAYFGATVTINGTNFGGQQGASYVTFPNSLTAAVVSWGNTAIQVTVPVGTDSGNVTVSTVGGGTSATGGSGDDFTLAPDSAGFPFTTPSDYTVSNASKAEVAGGMAQLKAQNSPTWMDFSWGYRQPVTVDNTAGGALTNYEAKLTITSANANFWANVASTGFDIRLTGSDGTTLRSYFRETWNYGGQSAVLWVKVPSIAAGGVGTLYLYYGNSVAGDASDIAAAFTFGDDFLGSTLDTAKWTQTGTASVSGGELTVSTGSVYSDATAASQAGMMSEAKVKWTGAASGYSGLNIANGQSTQGGNGGVNKLVYLMTNSGSLAVLTWAADGTVASYNIVSGQTQFTAVAGTSYVIGQEVTGSNVRLYRDGTQSNQYPGTWTGPFYLWLGYFTGAAAGATDITDLAVDWVRVRQNPSVAPSLSTGPQEAPAYPTDDPYVQPVESAGLAFGDLTSFSQTLGPFHSGGGASIEYQLSSNGTNWWHWNGLAWTEDPTPLSVTFGTETCTATEINTNAATYEDAAGPGTLVFKAFLHSNTGTGLAQLDSVSVGYTPPLSAPFISSLVPSTGASGAVVTISGTGFGATQGSSTVKFNGVLSGAVSTWSDIQIAAEAPVDVLTGPVIVRVNSMNSNSDKIFTAVQPSVMTLTPSTAYFNDTITIEGNGFGASQGSSYVTFPNNKVAGVSSWTNTSIMVAVPGGTTSGNVTVTTLGGGTSATGGPGDDFTLGPDNSTWPFSVGGDYSLSDAGKAEITGGMTQLKAQNSPAWMHPDWLYRRAVTVNNTGGALTNYAVRVAVDNTMSSFWSNVASSGFDVRITDQDGTTVLSMFRYKFDYAGQSAAFWVKAPTLPAASTRTLYLYYGSATAGDVSNIDNTFVFADDFADGTISTAKWNEIDNGAYISETGGKLVATGGNSTWTSNGVWNKSDFNRADGLALEWDYKWTGSQYFMYGWKDATAGTSYTNLIYGYYNSNGTTVVYEDGTSRGTQGSPWALGQQYRLRVILKTAAGATYQRSTDGGATWTTSYDSVYSTETPVRVALLNYNQAFEVDNLWVRSYVSGEPTATVGSQEAVSYVTDNPYVQNTALTPAYTNLVSFTHALGPSNTGTVEYQLSPNGTAWYYLNGTTWTQDGNPSVVVFGTETSTQSEINTNIGTFPSPGSFRFRAFMNSSGTQFAQLDGVSIVAVDITYTASTLTPTSVTQGDTNKSFTVQLTNNDTSAVTLTGSSYFQFTDGSQTYKAYVDKVGPVYPTLNPSTPLNVTFGSALTDGNGGGVTVPSGIAPQAYTPDVRLFSSSFSNVPVTITNQVTVAPLSTAPIINNLSPSSGASKVAVTINGVNFGASQGGSTVTFNGASAGTASAWSNTQITIDAPLNVTTGSVIVTVGGQGSNTNKVFTVNTPAVTSLLPAMAYFGGTVTINGTDFGAQQGASYVTFPNNQTASVTTWGNTAIQVTVPAGTTSGNVTVSTVGGGTSPTGGTGDDFTLTPDSAAFPFTTPSEYTVSSAAKAEVAGGMAQLKPQNSPTWMNVSWGYRQPVTVDNTGGGVLTNYEAKLTITSANASFWAGVASTGFDIRFTGSDGTTLRSYFRETWNYGGQSAVLWVKVPSIAAGGTETLYLYYGNGTAGDVSDLVATFSFADDFPGSTLDTAKWTTTGAATVSGGELSVTTGCVYSDNTVASQTGMMSEAKVKWTGAASGYSGLNVANGQSTQGGNAGANKLIYLMTNSGGFSVNTWAADGTVASYNVASGPAQFTAVAGTTYVIGHEVTGTQVKLYRDGTLTNGYNGTWTGAYYLYLGYFTGSASGATDITDIAVDWVRVRQSPSVVPSVSTGSQQQPSYATDDPYVQPVESAGKAFSELTAFSQTLGPQHNGGGASIEYQLSSNGTNWWYESGLAWVEDTTPGSVTFGTETSTAAEINAIAAAYENSAGAGTFVFRAFLHSNTGTGLAQLDSVSVSYTPPPSVPYVSSLNPATGSAGTAVTITGTSFGATQGASTVKFNGLASGSVSSWGDTQIVVDAPTDVTTGAVVVRVSNFNSNTDKIFTVAQPAVTSLNPSTAYYMEAITIGGTNFGAVQGSSYVTFPNNKTGSVVSWGNTTILVTVPSGTASGNVTVTTLGGGTSATGGAGDDFTLGPDTSTWPFTTPGNFTLSDSGKIEVSGGMAQLKAQNSPAWMDSAWSYRRPVTVNNTGGALSNYAVRVVLDNTMSTFWSNVASNGFDVRFTDEDGTTVLSYFRYKFDYAGQSAVIWVKAPTLPAASTRTLYLYYGNTTAGDVASMDNTFVLADDFGNGTIDAAKWNEIDNGLYISETGGKLVATGGSSGWTSNGIWSVSNFNRASGLAVEWDYKWTGVQYFMFGWKDSTAGTSYTDLIYGYYNSNGSTVVYEDGTSRGTFGTPWAVGQQYRIRVILKTGGGATYQRSTDGGATWTTSYDSSYSTETPVKVALLNYNQAFEVDNLWVRYYVSGEPSTSVGAQEQIGFPTDNPYVTPAGGQGKAYTAIQTFTHALGPSHTGAIEYQLSPNGTDWWYLSGTTWTQDASPGTIAWGTETSTQAEINTNIGAFDDAPLPASGTLFFRALLNSNGTQVAQLDGVSVTTVDISYNASTLSPTSVQQSQTNVTFSLTVTNNDPTDPVTLTGSSFFEFTDGSQTYKAYLDKVGPSYPTIAATGGTANLSFGSAASNGNGGGVNVPATIAAQVYAPNVFLTGTTFPTGFSLENVNNVTVTLPLDLTWDSGGADNNCSTIANWNLNRLPVPSDDVIIDSTADAIAWDAGCSGTISSLSITTGFSGSVTLATSLTVSGTTTVSAGTLDVGTGTLQADGNVNVASGGTFRMSGAGTLKLADTSTFQVNYHATTPGVFRTTSSSAVVTKTTAGSGGYGFRIYGTADISGLTFDYAGANGLELGNGTNDPTVSNFESVTFQNHGGAGTTFITIRANGDFSMAAPGITFGAITAGNNVKLIDNDGSLGGNVVFATFGASGSGKGDTYESDNDADEDGEPDTAGGDAVVQWSTGFSLEGSVVGFPTAAFDWNTYLPYAVYVATNDVGGASTADRLYVRDLAGNPLYTYDIADANGNILGTPIWDTKSETIFGPCDMNNDGDSTDSLHVLYVATGKPDPSSVAKIFLLVDTGSALQLPKSGCPWQAAYTHASVDEITSPLSYDLNNIYLGGENAADGARIFGVQIADTDTTPDAPVKNVGAASQVRAAPSWRNISGTVYLYAGSKAAGACGGGAHLYRVDTTGSGSVDSDNTSPQQHVNGMLSLVSSRAHAGDDGGRMHGVDNSVVGLPNLSGYPYRDTTNHSVANLDNCVYPITAAPNIAYGTWKVTFGDADGHFYVLNSSGTPLLGYPFQPGGSTAAFTNGGLTISGVHVTGNADGKVFYIDESTATVFMEYDFGSGVTIGQVGYNSNQQKFMMGTSDGDLYFVDKEADPTP